MGCEGGDMALAFDYIMQNPLETEADYAYTAVDGECTYDSSKGVGTVSSHIDVTPMSEDAMKAALMNGPVSVAIEADQLAFQLY